MIITLLEVARQNSLIRISPLSIVVVIADKPMVISMEPFKIRVCLFNSSNLSHMLFSILLRINESSLRKVLSSWLLVVRLTIGRFR